MEYPHFRLRILLTREYNRNKFILIIRPHIRDMGVDQEKVEGCSWSVLRCGVACKQCGNQVKVIAISVGTKQNTTFRLKFLTSITNNT